MTWLRAADLGGVVIDGANGQQSLASLMKDTRMRAPVLPKRPPFRAAFSCPFSCPRCFSYLTGKPSNMTGNLPNLTPQKKAIKKKNPEPLIGAGFLRWCGRWDLNPYDIHHTPLKRACLPIPALPQKPFAQTRSIICRAGRLVKTVFEKRPLRRAIRANSILQGVTK